MSKRVGRVATLTVAGACAAALALTPSMANAAQTWFTVELPANIDMSWCEPAGCAGRQTLPPSSRVINDAITNVVAVPGDPTDPYRHASLVTYGYGSFAATQAAYAMQSSLAGRTWPGYNELPSDPTVVGIIMLRNPGRPNGGLAARTAPAAAIFGINTVTPPSTNNPLEPVPVPTDERLLTSFIDVAREYDGHADFPATANPFAVANAIAGAIFLRDYSSAWPVVLDIDGDDPNGKAYLAPAPDQTVYYTQFTNQLQLLVPFRRVEETISHITGPLPFSISDAIEPALKILVNIGYTDVQTPSEGGTYDRTLDQIHAPTPFMSTSPLTAGEWLRVPIDVALALVRGIHDELRQAANFGTTPAPQRSETPMGTRAPAVETDAPTTAVNSSNATAPTERVSRSVEPASESAARRGTRPPTPAVGEPQNGSAPKESAAPRKRPSIAPTTTNRTPPHRETAAPSPPSIADTDESAPPPAVTADGSTPPDTKTEPS